VDFSSQINQETLVSNLQIFMSNWSRVSIRLDTARLDERLGWEEMAAATRAGRRCVSWREDFGMAKTNGIAAGCADWNKDLERGISCGSSGAG
jgi:hypothetical protein